MSSVINKEIASALIDPAFSKILRGEYVYKILEDGRYWNQTLFSDLGGLQIGATSSDIEKALSTKLREKRGIVENFLISGGLGVVGRQILEESDMMIRIVLYALPFEIEKYNGEQHQVDTKKIVSRIENLERQIFGPRVCEDPESLPYVKGFLQDILEKFPSEDLDPLKKIIEEIDGDAKMAHNTFFEDELDFAVSRDQYVAIFDEVIKNVYYLEEPVQVVDGPNVFVEEGRLIVPTISEYDELPARRVLELIAHEIETHLLTDHNHKNTFFAGLTSISQLEREEGLAMVMEGLVTQNLIEPRMTLNFCLVYLAEMLEGEEFQKIMTKLITLSGKEGNPVFRFLRRKRNYPLNFRGTQHKDTFYYRGQKKVLAYEDPGWLFSGRLSFRELSVVEATSFITPTFIPQMITFVLKSEEITGHNYRNFLRERYAEHPFLPLMLEAEFERHLPVVQRIAQLLTSSKAAQASS